jgi:hypothetical protein
VNILKINSGLGFETRRFISDNYILSMASDKTVHSQINGGEVSSSIYSIQR